MTRGAKTSCARSWEVEAARDGRLSPDAHASMQRHLTTCAACRDERAHLADLGAALRDDPPKLDDVALRKLKQSVLERADGIQSGRVVATRPATRWIVLALPLAAAIGMAYAVHARTPALAPTEQALVIASPIGAAQWQRTATPLAERIALTDGTLALDVHRKPGQKPLTVAVPDGEIEDVGTIFRVTVA
ncbi:MAG: hypothetical protein JWM74_2189, partial [Myxococcaceae bacterium]|nr:hypothetical protein [Myxococcaceae bacterium]